MIDHGSSPHTRGALGATEACECHLRIIPAYAGSTYGEAAHYCQMPDHPRIRGEHKDEEKTATIESGSSPHTRGARARNFSVDRESRIIPAYAGSTTTPTSM